MHKNNKNLKWAWLSWGAIIIGALMAIILFSIGNIHLLSVFAVWISWIISLIISIICFILSKKFTNALKHALIGISLIIIVILFIFFGENRIYNKTNKSITTSSSRPSLPPNGVGEGG